ncbi:ChrR family anti-sigma-E factor [Aliamphritea spongicola]|uniref:ChrR family anti-sigma-E factor n=1 Tax=Aliamphritea spongicola TaxID=707589 RepID=UPI00196ABE1C|nr:ChrR family anti-sigma-E factor [Aliamphritea spongicola]MBN3564363.1 cupin domain-containing protein [Aliamphritea spongicola]
MSIRHHLDEATLLSYAAGSLSQGMALVVACHLSMCPQCRERAAAQEAVGGSLLEDLAPAQVSADTLDNLLAMLDVSAETMAEVQAETVRKETAPEERARQTGSHLPAPLGDYLPYALEDVPWKKLVSGISYYDLDCQSGGVSRLMRIAPGKNILPHTHKGNELTLVLQGSFCDEIGRFARGDIADLDEQVEHQPLVDSNVDCICLIATDAPLKFTTLLGRLVQPVTGF